MRRAAMMAAMYAAKHASKFAIFMAKQVENLTTKRTVFAVYYCSIVLTSQLFALCQQTRTQKAELHLPAATELVLSI